MLTIENDWQKILASNFWDTEAAASGKFYLSINAGAFRLLAPDEIADDLAQECKLARMALISLGPWPAAGQTRAAEILLEDDSNSPYVLHLSEAQIDRWPMPGADGRRCAFALWGRGPKLIAELPGRVQFVDRLPYLKKWGK